ncbi:hypothetical protein FF021_00650 [Leptospira noguchii]|nr:hypothetical protein FF021_00650 [Leptospira noguchii]
MCVLLSSILILKSYSTCGCSLRVALYIETKDGYYITFFACNLFTRAESPVRSAIGSRIRPNFFTPTHVNQERVKFYLKFFVFLRTERNE